MCFLTLKYLVGTCLCLCCDTRSLNMYILSLKDLLCNFIDVNVVFTQRLYRYTCMSSGLLCATFHIFMCIPSSKVILKRKLPKMFQVHQHQVMDPIGVPLQDSYLNRKCRTGETKKRWEYTTAQST